MGLRLTACLAACLLGGVAQADIFSYTDVAGVVHYSNVPTDTRYSLLLSAPIVTPAPSPREQARHLADAAQYDRIIEQAAQGMRLHPALVRAVIAVESGFDPHAVSARGAKGLMQLEPDTAARYGVSDLFDPSQNIGAGTRYLHDLLARYDGKLEIALAAYNAGEQAVQRYGGHIPPYSETRRYVPAVLHVYKTLLAQATIEPR